MRRYWTPYQRSEVASYLADPRLKIRGITTTPVRRNIHVTYDAADGVTYRDSIQRRRRTTTIAQWANREAV